MDKQRTIRITSAFIRQLRQEACISQEELGRRIGRSRGYIGKIEKDCSHMTVVDLSRIFKSVGREVGDVLTDWKKVLDE